MARPGPGDALRLCGVLVILLPAVLLSLVGCTKRELVLELSGAVMYEKPTISSVSHTLADSRLEGGTAVVSITMTGDAGLVATFDISPGIADRVPMRETEDGNYEGTFSLPSDVVGGPFTIIVRLQHEEAGEVILRDPNPLSVPFINHHR